MKAKTKIWITASFLTVFFYGGVGELPAQQAVAEVNLKQLIVKKFDKNGDGNLVASEQVNAVAFLKSMDKNVDGQISLSEKVAATAELTKMKDRKGTEKATIENRNAAKRESSWGQFVRSLPHGNGSRTFTTRPGSPGFDINGEKDVDLTDDSRRGVAPDVNNMTAEELEKRKKEYLANLARDNKRKGVDATKLAPKGAVAASNKVKSYYDGMVILFNKGAHAVVPQGAIINLPSQMKEWVIEEPQGKIMKWPKFLKINSRYLATKEVSWDRVVGKDPIKEEEKKMFTRDGKLVIAVFHKNPVTVLEPPAVKAGEQVLGSVASESNGK